MVHFGEKNATLMISKPSTKAVQVFRLFPGSKPHLFDWSFFDAKCISDQSYCRNLRCYNLVH